MKSEQRGAVSARTRSGHVHVLCPFPLSFAYLSQLIHDVKLDHPRNDNAHCTKVVLVEGTVSCIPGEFTRVASIPDSPVTFVRV